GPPRWARPTSEAGALSHRRGRNREVGGRDGGGRRQGRTIGERGRRGTGVRALAARRTFGRPAMERRWPSCGQKRPRLHAGGRAGREPVVRDGGRRLSLGVRAGPPV